MHLTNEQLAVVKSDAETLKVLAFAGTGKTSTLVQFAKHRPRERMLYLAFNRSVKEEAARRFPQNTRCMTAHGLAYKHVGHLYRDKLTRNLKAPETADTLQLRADGEQRFIMAKTIEDCLAEYLRSADRHQEPQVPPDPSGTELMIVDHARQLWARMRDPSDAAVKITHDGYLKLFQLSDPRLPYEYILFDEAQDADPVILDIIRTQRCRKVFVGDTHQQIYSFRGAVDAMQNIGPAEELPLTESFRFGQNIADIAHRFVRLAGTRHRIKGCRSRPFGSSRAILTRGNVALFEHAVELVRSGERPYFVGGIDGYRFGDLLDVLHLRHAHHKQINSGFLKRFKDLPALEAFVAAVDDRELLAAIRVVNGFGEQIPELVAAIHTAAVDRLEDADCALATVHKAKGLEFTSVQMADDFPEFQCKAEVVLAKEAEEVNILYVGATRAERSVRLPESGERLLKHLKEHPDARLEAPRGESSHWRRIAAKLDGRAPRREPAPQKPEPGRTVDVAEIGEHLAGTNEDRATERASGGCENASPLPAASQAHSSVHLVIVLTAVVVLAVIAFLIVAALAA